MRRQIGSLLLGASLVVGGCATQHESLESCLQVAERGHGAEQRRQHARLELAQLIRRPREQ